MITKKDARNRNQDVRLWMQETGIKRQDIVANT